MVFEPGPNPDILSRYKISLLQEDVGTVPLLKRQLLEPWPTITLVRELYFRWIVGEYQIGDADHEYGISGWCFCYANGVN